MIYYGLRNVRNKKTNYGEFFFSKYEYILETNTRCLAVLRLTLISHINYLAPSGGQFNDIQ